MAAISPPPMPIRTETKPVFDSMLKVISPDRVIRQEQIEAERRRAEEAQNKPEILGLAQHLRLLWQAAYTAKQTARTEDQGSVETRLMRCLRQRQGQYEPEEIAEIERIGQPVVWMNLSEIKASALQAFLEDVHLPPDESIFDISPTPVPTLPQAEEAKIVEVVYQETVEEMYASSISAVTPQKVEDRMMELRDKIAQERTERAKKAARHQARKIEDEFQEGDFYLALKDFINDLSTFPSAFLWGPVVRKEPRVTWAEDGRGGVIPKIQPKFVRKYERASPFDIYPSPGAKHIQDGYLFRKRSMRRSDLEAMIGVPGFSADAIRSVLESPPPKEWSTLDTEKEAAYSRDDQNDPDPIMDVLEFWGNLQGKLLREWGMKPRQIPDPLKQYNITAWLVGQVVICARLNPHPLGRRPCYSTSYRHVPDSVWGRSPLELMRNTQRMGNAAARDTLMSMAFASGPQVEINMDRVEPGTDVESIWPYKIWQTKSDPTGSTGAACQFFQPQLMSNDLWTLFERFSRLSSEETGIPDFTHAGMNASRETGDTASGMSMQISQSGRVMKMVIREIDSSIVKLAVKDHWMHVMLFDEDEYRIGDINIVARASEHLIVAESLQLRITEFMNAINNPWVERIIGDKGMAELLRHRAKWLKLPVEKIVPSEEQMEAREEAARQLPGGQGGQVRQMKPRGAIQMERLTPAGGKQGEALRMAA